MAEDKKVGTEGKEEGKAKEEKKRKPASTDSQPPTPATVDFDPYKILKSALSTEKSIRQIEFDNKLVFAVYPKATKTEVKRAVEELFKVKVAQVNIQNSFTGQKKAYVKLTPAFLASDVSADLGMI